MDGVVTVFLRNRGEVLLLGRSDDVDSDRRLWGAVAGQAEGGPDAAAREEIREETGLHEAVSPVRRGEPVEVDDRDRGTRWLVHPFLFDADSRAVDPNDGTTGWEWVPPPEILRRETVPDLWTAYDRVRPRVETVATDETHGSAYVSARALEVLRDEAALAAERNGDYDGLVSLARDLRDARPSLQAVANRVDRAMATADETPGGVERAATAVLEQALSATDRVAEHAAPLTDGCVLTLSRSGTVAAALDRARPREVLVMESRPAREGVDVAEALADETDVTLFVDAAVAHVLGTRDVDRVLVGADAVLPEGRVVNKVGTRTAAIAAARADVPVYALCSRDKVVPDVDEPDFEPGDPEAVYDGDAEVDVANPTFDVTPADLIAGVVTENGVLDADEVGAVAEELEEFAGWDA
jgi:translation initiation factor 2B subunit (eIF-2B alpha/beta/delta family)